MTMQGWLDGNGNYYQGDQRSPADTPVPIRPDATCTWTNGAWVKGAPPVIPPTPDQIRLTALETDVAAIKQKLGMA